MRMNRLSLLVGAVILSCSLAACSERTTHAGGGGGSGGTGGTGGTGGSPFGDTTVYDLQNPETQPAPNTEVVLKNVVVTAVVERRQGDGTFAPQHFFVQEKEGGPWSGIYIRNGADGAAVVPAPAVGDVVQIAGTLTEYYDRTQVEVLTLEKTGTAEVPAPALLTPEQIATNGADAEAYEGVLVRVENVGVTELQVLDESKQDRGGFRVNTVGQSEGGVVVGTTNRTGYVRAPKDTFAGITGILDFSYEEFRLEPRNADDVSYADGSHPATKDGGERTVYELQDQTNPGYFDWHAPATVTVKNVVVTANAGSRIWVQEQGAKPYSGIQVRLADGQTAPAIGSVVTVTGTYTEYFAVAQIDVATVESTGTAAVPAPQSVTTAEIRTGAESAEQWEGVLVQLADVKNVEFQVKGTDNQWRGDFRVAPISGGTDSVIVGHIFADDYASKPDCSTGETLCDAQPDQFATLAGVLDYSYSEFRLETRGNDDMTFVGGGHPEAPNVGTVSIAQLQDTSRGDYVGTDVSATVEGAIVTAATTQGFFIEDAAGGPWSGVYVRIPTGSTVAAPAVGSVVTVSGKVFEYFNKTQLQATAVEVTGTGTLPAATTVDAVAIATGGAEMEKYEGVLVEVKNVSNVEDPVLSNDGKDRGDFRVGPAGGSAGVIVGHLFVDDYNGSVGDTFRSLVGVLDYSFDEARLETRGNADITLGNGSHPTPPEATGVTVFQIQDPNAANKPAVDSSVRITGAVVTAASSKGFWIEETTGGAYSGIYAFLPSGSTATIPAVGKVVTVEGKYKEYFDLSEIEVASVTVTGDGTVPAPAVVTAEQIMNGGARSEELEGVLVKVQNVVNTEDPVLGSDGQDHGDFRVASQGSTGGVVVGKTIGHGYAGNVGDGFQSIVGVVHYAYENFRLEPRGNDDITLADGSHPGTVVTPGGVVTVFDVQNAAATSHPAVNSQVEVRNVVVTAIKGTSGFYVSEAAGGAFSGIYVFRKGNTQVSDLAVGDVVTVTGKYVEYMANGTARELSEIELGTTGTVTRTATGSTVAPIAVTPADIAATGTGEAYESCLVTVTDLTVNNVGTSYFKAQRTVDTDLSDEVFIGKVFMPNLALTADQHLTSVTGIVDDFSSTYRLHPRGDFDLVLAQ